MLIKIKFVDYMHWKAKASYLGVPKTYVSTENVVITNSGYILGGVTTQSNENYFYDNDLVFQGDRVYSNSLSHKVPSRSDNKFN